jgi:outer membrane protein assembly factor BamB
MPSKAKSPTTDLLFVGIKGSVLAIRKYDGAIAWSTKLRRGSSFVPILQEGDRLYAASGGEVTCLNGASGRVLWNNRLPGYGMGYAAIAGAGLPISAVALEDAARTAAIVGASSA